MKYLFPILIFICCAAKTQERGFIVGNKTILTTEPYGRIALVIGNNNYKQPDAKLKNPINDADDMSETLQKLGFNIIKHTNLNRVDMLKVINEFGKQLNNYEVGLFYYSGHAIQYQGENYLIPIDAQIESYSDNEFENVPLERVLGKFKDSKINTSIVFLDACRNNPFPKSSARGEPTKGLTKPTSPSGSIIVYSTSEGSTADDNSNARNGLFTQELLKQIIIPDLSLSDIIINTRNKVVEISNSTQEPADYSKLRGQFYFLKNSKVSENITDELLIKSEIEEGKKAYENGEYKKANDIFIKILQTDISNSEAQVYIGHLNFYGYGIKTNYQDAFGWYLKASKLNNPQGQFMVGFCFLKGIGVHKDYYSAIKYFHLAAEQNFAKAQYSIGICFLNGFGIEKNYTEALKWFQKALDQNDSEAQYAVGFMYESGFGVKKKLNKAIEYYKKSANQNNVEAQKALVRLLKGP